MQSFINKKGEAGTTAFIPSYSSNAVSAAVNPQQQQQRCQCKDGIPVCSIACCFSICCLSVPFFSVPLHTQNMEKNPANEFQGEKGEPGQPGSVAIPPRVLAGIDAKTATTLIQGPPGPPGSPGTKGEKVSQVIRCGWQMGCSQFASKQSLAFLPFLLKGDIGMPGPIGPPGLSGKKGKKVSS